MDSHRNEPSAKRHKEPTKVCILIFAILTAQIDPPSPGIGKSHRSHSTSPSKLKSSSAEKINRSSPEREKKEKERQGSPEKAKAPVEKVGVGLPLGSTPTERKLERHAKKRAGKGEGQTMVETQKLTAKVHTLEVS